MSAQAESTRVPESDRKSTSAGGAGRRDLSTYVCGACRAAGVKLWRYSHSSDKAMRCGPCARSAEKKTFAINDDGEHVVESGSGQRAGSVSWCIGNYVPAILMDRVGGGYWTITSDVAEGDYSWWRALPLVNGDSHAASAPTSDDTNKATPATATTQ